MAYLLTTLNVWRTLQISHVPQVVTRYSRAMTQENLLNMKSLYAVIFVSLMCLNLFPCPHQTFYTV
jgi:hypothetical protein